MTSEDIEIEKDSYWRFRRLSDNEFYLRRQIAFKQTRTVFDAMGPTFLLGICELTSGSLVYDSNKKKIKVPWDRYAFFMPPFSITRAVSESLHQSVDFLISTASHQGLPKVAGIFPFDGKLPTTFAGVQAVLQSTDNFVCIEACALPSALSRKVKSALDRSFKHDKQLSKIADDLGVSQTLMGRYFKKDFGISPSAYRNHLRIVSASFDLIAGAEIVDSFQKVGFADLSLFYKQFKRITRATPGEYRAKKSKITKK